MPLKNKAFTATPISNNKEMELFFPPLVFDKANTEKVPIMPPREAITGNEMLLVAKEKVLANTIKRAAPKEAPLDVPIIPGSTMGFLNKACAKIPPTAKVDPTKTLMIVLGKRISMKILSFSEAVSVPLQRFAKALLISLIEMLTAPKQIENSITIANKISNAIKRTYSFLLCSIMVN